MGYDSAGRGSDQTMIRNIKIIIILLLIIAALIFALQNLAEIEIRFLLWRFTLPSALVVAIMVGGGCIIGMLLRSLMSRRG